MSFIAGVFVGANLGIIVAAMCFVAGQADAEMENERDGWQEQGTWTPERRGEM